MIGALYFLHSDHIYASTATGNTIDEIAVEKAGIMKSGVDVLVGPGCPTDLMKVGNTNLMKSFTQHQYRSLHDYSIILDAGNA